MDDGDEFDWEAAVREIDVACQATTTDKPTSNCNLNYHPEADCFLVQEVRKYDKINVNFSSAASSRQSTLDRFLGVSSNAGKFERKADFSEGLLVNHSNLEDNEAVGAHGDVEMLNGVVKIDPSKAHNWIYPVNFSPRDYQFSITRTALFSNTLVVLPTGLGKTLIAAVVMFNYFRWFPEGKIVFAAPSRPLVLQQIEACHKIVGISQEWTIDLTGQTNPMKRASLWKEKRVFFVTPQVLEKDIQSGSCSVKHLVCLVIDEAHRAMGNYSYCVAVRELMDAPVPLRILALTATPGSKQQTIQHIINNLQISTLEYRNENDPDVRPFVHERKIELVEVAMGDEAVEINNLLLEVVRPFVTRLSTYGVLPKRDFQTLSPCDLLNSRAQFRQEPPPSLSHTKFGEIEGYFGVLITLYHVRKLLSSHGIRPAFEMLDEKLKQGSFARFMSRNDVLLKAKLLMEQFINHGAPSPKLATMLEVLTNHFKANDPQNSRVIIFSNFRGSVRDIMNALRNLGEYVKATEFIGQSSGKTLKGQSQKVQQAVLQKFRTGGYNVIVATSIGEEGLDIMEVDLVICFDANVSPLRMIQRMGRTGRKHEGRVVVLACEGSELKGYKQKQANNKAIKKHMLNGGLNSFDFHPSARMVPHVFKPEVQFVEMSIEEFIPRGRKAKDDNPIAVRPCLNKLTDAEIELLAKYFASGDEISWRPSLIAYPHFQACPSPVNKVIHSSRTGMMIDVMQYLQGFTLSEGNQSFLTKEEDISDSDLKVELMEPLVEIIKAPDKIDYPVEEKLVMKVADTDIQGIARTKDVGIKGFQKQCPSCHNFLFGGEFVSLDDIGNVLVLSLPWQLLEFPSKCKYGEGMISMHNLVHHEDNTVQAKRCPSESKPCEIEDLLESTLCKPDAEKSEALSRAEKILQTPVLRRLTELGSSGEDHNVAYDRTPMQLGHDSGCDFGDPELSPRLTNFIKSGIVPESPLNIAGTLNPEESNFSVPTLVSSPSLRSEFLKNTCQQDEKAIQEGSLDKAGIPCFDEHRTPVLHLKNTPRSCTSPVPVIKEMQTPFAKLSNTSSIGDLLLESAVQPETVEQPHKFRRLRKHGESNRHILPPTKEQSGPSRKRKTSDVTHKLVKGTAMPTKVVAEYIDEEAEVSGEQIESDDEEGEPDNSSYEDSFIDDDDDTNPSASTQAGVKTDMMAIYRRSLLSQSPFQRLPSFPTYISPGSVIRSSSMDESEDPLAGKSNQTPEVGLESIARISQFVCDRTSLELAETENKQESRKRKLSFHQTKSLPVVNLNKGFSLISEAAGKRREEDNPDRRLGQLNDESSIHVQVERTKESKGLFEDEDDQFYNDIDLDALEKEAANLLRCKSQCSNQRTALPPDPLSQDIGILDSPSFDLGI